MRGIKFRIQNRNDLAFAEIAGRLAEKADLADFGRRIKFRFQNMHRLNFCDRIHKTACSRFIEQIRRQFAGKAVREQLVAVADLEFRIEIPEFGFCVAADLPERFRF